jgi:adenylate cyclase
LTKALKIAREVGSKDQLMIIYQRFAELYEKQKKWRNFAKYFKKYYLLEKELKSEEIQRKAAQYEMQKELELKEKEAEIERLRNVELKKAFNEIELRNTIIQSEKIKSEKLLLNILPAEIAQELKETGFTRARHYDNVSVMFTDFKGFTTISEKLSAQELVDELHACFMAFDSVFEKHKLEKIKTIGDSYMAVSGLPVSDPDHAEKMVNAAIEISEFMKKRKKKMGENSFEMRIGIHSGSVVAGVVGIKKFAYDIWGDTVNIASRMEHHCEPGKINISANTFELIKNKYKCTYRGKIDVKNKGCVEMYYLEKN